MSSREIVQKALNQNATSWGMGGVDHHISRWQVDPAAITPQDVIEAGIRHACPVIDTVLKRPSQIDNLRAYEAKNASHMFMLTVFHDADRVDLMRDWLHGELRAHHEKTHWDLRHQVQYPSSVDPKVIARTVRMPTFYVCDLLKTIELANQQEIDKILLNTPAPTSTVWLTRHDLVDAASKAKDLDGLAVEVAYATALNLHHLGFDNTKISSILVKSFAKVGLIREFGQQHHAQKIVDGIIARITASGQIPGLARQFREQARPLVQKSYQGQVNPQLAKTK